MQFALATIGILVLIWTELTLLPLPFSFIALFIWFLYVSEPQAYILAFFAGVIVDTLLLEPVGKTALLFLLLLFIASSYKRKFHSHHFLFLAVFSFLSTLLITFIYQGTMLLFPSLFSMTVTLLFARFLFKRPIHYEKSWHWLS